MVTPGEVDVAGTPKLGAREDVPGVLHSAMMDSMTLGPSGLTPFMRSSS